MPSCRSNRSAGRVVVSLGAELQKRLVLKDQTLHNRRVACAQRALEPKAPPSGYPREYCAEGAATAYAARRASPRGAAHVRTTLRGLVLASKDEGSLREGDWRLLRA